MEPLGRTVWRLIQMATSLSHTRPWVRSSYWMEKRIKLEKLFLAVGKLPLTSHSVAQIIAQYLSPNRIRVRFFAGSGAHPVSDVLVYGEASVRFQRLCTSAHLSRCMICEPGSASDKTRKIYRAFVGESIWRRGGESYPRSDDRVIVRDREGPYPLLTD